MIQNIFLKRIFTQIEKKEAQEARQNDTCKIILITIFLGKTKKNKFKTFFFVSVKKNLARKMVIQNHVQKNLIK